MMSAYRVPSEILLVWFLGLIPCATVSDQSQDDYTWLVNKPGFNTESCFPVYRVSDSKPVNDRVLFLEYAGSDSHLKIASHSNMLKVRLNPESLLTGFSLGFGASGKDSPDVIGSGIPKLRRLRAGLPSIPCLELVRKLVSLPGPFDPVDVAVWGTATGSEGVIIVHSSSLEPHYRARCVFAGPNLDEQKYCDPYYAEPSVVKIFAVTQVIDIDTTSFANADDIRSALEEFFAQLPTKSAIQVESLGSRGITYSTDAGYVQLLADRLTTDTVLLNTELTTPKELHLAPVEEVLKNYRLLASGSQAFDSDREFLKKFENDSTKIYRELIQISALSEQECQGDLIRLGLIQHPIINLMP